MEKPRDFRSEKNQFSGYEYRGAMREKNGPKDILYARMVGEPTHDQIEMNKPKGKGKEGNYDVLSGLLNMKINDGEKRVKKKITKMVVEGSGKGKQKYKRVSCKKQRRRLRF